MEDKQVPHDTEAGPLEVVLGAVGTPEIHAQPDSLLSNKVGVSRPRPEAADHEATLQVFRSVLVLVRTGNPSVVMVFLLRVLEVPLLLVGKKLDNDEEENSARESQVGNVKDLGALVRQNNKNVGRSRDEEEQRRLDRGNEDKVENSEKEGVVHSRAHDLPAVIFRADLVAAFAPVVEGQANLEKKIG